MIVRRLLLLVAAVAVAALAGPALADAQPVKFVKYTALVEGEGDYHGLGDGPYREYSAKWKWKTTFPSVVFAGNRAITTDPANRPTGMTAELVGPAYGARSFGSEITSCQSDRLFAPSPGRFLEPYNHPSRSPQINLRVFHGAWPDFTGCPGQAATEFTLAGNLLGDVYTYDISFPFLSSLIGQGKIIEFFDERETGGYCPNNVARTLVQCTLRFKGTVTFTKVAEWIEDDGAPGGEPAPADPGTPAAPAAPAGATPGGTASPRAQAPSAGAPAVGRGAKLASNHGSAVIPVTCASDCAGTVTASALSGRTKAKASAAAARVLARATFRAKAGKTARVTLRFSRAERRVIRRAGGIRVTVRSGAAKRTLTLRAKR